MSSYFFSAVLIPKIEYGVQCLKIELKSPVKAIRAKINFQGEVLTRFIARAMVASVPNVVRKRRSKPPTFSSKNNFLRFVDKTPFKSSYDIYTPHVLGRPFLSG